MNYDFDTVLDIDINESFDDANATELIFHCLLPLLLLLLLLFLLPLLLSLECTVGVACDCDGCICAFDGDAFCVSIICYAADLLLLEKEEMLVEKNCGLKV